MSLKVVVNKEKCIGCGACVAIAPETFDFDEEGISSVINETVTEKAKEAEEVCPVFAIDIIETKEKEKEKEKHEEKINETEECSECPCKNHECECDDECNCGDDCECDDECDCSCNHECDCDDKCNCGDECDCDDCHCEDDGDCSCNDDCDCGDDCNCKKRQEEDAN